MIQRIIESGTMGFELNKDASHAVSRSSGKAVTPLRMRPTMKIESQKRVDARSWALFWSGEGIGAMVAYASLR